MQIFTSLERRPLKDGFHAINGATKLLHDGSPEGKAEFSQDVAEAIRPPCGADVRDAANWVLERPARKGSKSVANDAEALAVAKQVLHADSK